MAAATYSATTSGTDLAKVWKKLQGDLIVGFNSKCEEWRWLRDLEDFDVNFSAREVTSPIDITPETSAASIPEGGYESNPITTAPQELTFTWINLNKRFTRSLLAKYLDARAGSSQIESQMKYQGRKLMEGLVNHVGWMFYGTSTAYACQTSTNATSASQTLTLINGFGQSDIDTAAYLAARFQIGDRIGLVRSGSLVTNGIGAITATTPATPSIAATMIGSCDVDANDYVVLANSLENASLAGTDYNKGLVGLIDGAVTTSIHGLSGSTYPKYSAYQDTAGGRFDFSKLRAGQYAIQNNGGGKANRLIVSNGVLTDMTLQQQASLRFDDALNMEFDGAVKLKGAVINTSRKAPPNRAFLLDDRKAVFKWALQPLPSEDGFPEGAANTNTDKLQDVSAEAHSLDLSLQMVWKNRSCLAYYTGLTEA